MQTLTPLISIVLTVAMMWPGPIRAQALTPIPPNVDAVLSIINPPPRPKPDFDKDVLEPLRKAQAEKRAAELKADCDVRRGVISGDECIVPQPPTPVYYAPQIASPAPSWGGLVGRIGWAKPYGNCVNTVKAFGKNQPGNPSSWYTTTRTPFIGAAAVFYYNHAGIVVGIWGNGDVEIAHENYRGGQTRFSPGQIRGYF